MTNVPWWEPVTRQEGDEYAFEWRVAESPQGLLILMSHLREDSKREVHGEIRIDTVNAQMRVLQNLHWSSINLSGQNARRDLAKEMTGREAEMLDWARAIRYACTSSAIQWRAGEPEVILSRLKLDDGPADLISGFLPMGETSTIYGDGNSTKSLTAVTAGLAVALGKPLGVFQPTMQANVLILDWETTDQEHGRRLYQLANGLFQSIPDNIVYQHMQRGLVDDMARLRSLIARHQIGFVIVDSLAPAVGGDQKEESEVVGVFNALRTLKGITRLVISHIAKGDREKQNDSPYGSVFVSNLSRVVWKVKRVGGSADEAAVTGLYCTKRNRGSNYRPIGLRYDFDDTNAITQVAASDLAADPELAKHLPLSERITQALLGGGRMTKERIAEITDSTVGAVGSALSRMNNVIAFPPQSGAGQGRAFLYAVKARQGS